MLAVDREGGRVIREGSEEERVNVKTVNLLCL